MQRVTFDQLPELVAEMNQRLERIEQILSNSTVQQKPSPSSFLNIQQAALFLDLTVSSLYKKTSARQIPFYKKGSRIRFSKEELEEWIRGARVKTLEELDQEAVSYIQKRRHITRK